MKTGTIVKLAVVGLLAIFFFMGCNGYNGLIKQDEAVKKALSNVDVEYKKRAELVPNLVNTVKGAANFEQETLTKVLEARAKATSIQLNPENMAKYEEAQSQLSGSLSRLILTVENYPDLKAVESFKKLQDKLEDIENEIKNSRKMFNEAINGYNLKVRSFPMNLFAGMFGFKVKEGFKAEPGNEKAPEVKFE